MSALGEFHLSDEAREAIGLPAESEARAELDEDIQRLADDLYKRRKAERLATERLEAETPLPPLVTHTLADLQEMPALSWIVQDVIPRNAVCILAGPGGIGKSALLIDLCLRVASGGRFLGRHKAQSGRVLYVAGEGAYGYGQRVQAARAAHGIETLPADTFTLVSDGFRLSERASVARLAEFVAEHSIDLVVLDTLSSLATITAENDNAEAARLVAAAQTIARARDGVSVILAHHVPKDATNAGPRGASAFRDNTDAVWILKGDRHGFSMSSEAEHGGKLKDGPSRVIKGLSLQEAHGSIVLRWIDMAAIEEPGILSSLRAGVRAMSPAEMTTAELMAMFRQIDPEMPQRTAERHMQTLTAEGALVKVRKGVYRCESVERSNVTELHAA